MLARPKLTSSNNARNYFENDTYYLNNEFEEGTFYGKLKDELGLKDFNLEDFDKVLMGQNLEGENLLNLSKKDFDENGERKRAACDLTFSADKDISILYEVSDEKTKAKIREAFNKSIDSALDFAEENYSYRKDRNNRKGEKAQSKMLFARFDHSESRSDDMHLHVHALAMNMIQDENGNWKTVEYNQIMENHQLLGQIQRNEFAKELQKMGVELEISSVKNGTFKSKNVEKEVRDMFSTRSKEIQKEMEKSGQHSYKATHTAQKQTAKWKDKNKDRAQIQKDNIAKLEEAGADISKIKKLKEIEIRELSSEKIVELAFDDITDKMSVFKKEDILKHSLKLSLLSDISINELEVEFEKYSDLICINEQKNQYTTKEILEKEEFIFSQKEEKTFNITDDKEQIESAIKEFEDEKGFSLKDGQRDLANTVLSSDNQFIIAQGVAGAGKSTSLEIVRKVSEEQGINIVALAPTGTATDNLAKEAGITQNMTVAKFIQEQGADIKDSLVIVDEAGMMGLRDTYELVKIAKENNLKVVFSGDANQKKSISQGDIFPGMQRKGFETVILAEGNRQKNEKMQLAVKNILDKNISDGLNILKDTTYEIKGDERLNAAMRRYLKDKDKSLLITTTNSDRVKLNEMIRNHLVKTEQITNSKEFDLRETINLSDLEKRSALHYKEKQKVFLSKNIGSISAGREAVIKSIDLKNNTITIEHFTNAKKPKRIVEEVNLTEDGNKLNLFEDRRKDLGIGDKIIMKKNDKKLGLSNGQTGTITNIEKDKLTVQFDKKEITFSTKDYKYINHAYAITDFASQGKTTDHVIAVANSQAASFNDFYTQITRAKYEATIITDDKEELQKRAALDSQKLNASELIKKEKDMKLTQELAKEEQEARKEQQIQAYENQKEINKKNEVKVSNEKDETSFIEKIDKASDLYEKVEFVKDHLSPDSDISKIIQDKDTLNVAEEMIKDYGMKNLDKESISNFKKIASNVLEQITENPTLSFNMVMKEAVKYASKTFEKQMGKTFENTM